MNALVWRGPREMVWTSVPDPPPDPPLDDHEWVSVKVSAVGICGSDIHGYTGESGRRSPGVIMGHEAVGTVLDTGGVVSADRCRADPQPSLRPGTPVVLFPIAACGSCDQCRNGDRHRCRIRQFYGGTVNGAMAERMVVPRENVIAVSQESAAPVLVLAEPLAVAMHAVDLAGDLTGRRVLVCGGGPIGQLVSWYARNQGARHVAVSEPIAARRNVALSLGANAVLNPVGTPGKRSSRPSEHEEYDVTCDAVGTPAAVGDAVAYARPGGCVLLIGGRQTASVPLPVVVTKELRLRGSFNYSRREFRSAIDLVTEHGSVLRQLITDVEPMSDGPSVFARIATDPGRSVKTVLVIDWTTVGGGRQCI